MKKEFDPIDAFVFPTTEFTRRSPHKIVRALGSIALIPMFPWALFATLIVLVIWLTIAGVIAIHDWWEEI